MVKVIGWEAVDGGLTLCGWSVQDAKDLADVGKSVTGHDEGELGLARVGALNDRDQQRAGVED